MTTYVASPDERRRKLDLARAAVASAALNGCTEAEILAAVRAGLDEGAALNGVSAATATAPAQRSGDSPATTPAPLTGALAAFAAAVG